MRHYLIVAHKTLVGPHLIEWVRRAVAEGPCRFHLIVPLDPGGSVTWTEHDLRTAAEERLQEGLTALREVGAEVGGEVGDGHPVLAVQDVLNRGMRVDEIVLSTLPRGMSRWLRLDVPRRLANAVRIPVTHLIAEPATTRT